MKAEPDKVPSAKSFTDEYLLFLLAQASAVASEEFHAQMRRKNIAVSTWRILASLHPNQKLTVGALADMCLLKQPTLTRTLDRLEKDALVQRSHSTTDRRTVFVELTSQGKKIASENAALARAHERNLLVDYTDEQIRSLKKSLKRLMQRGKID